MKQPVRSHRDLIVWQRAVKSAVHVYQVHETETGMKKWLPVRLVASRSNHVKRKT